MKLNIFQKIAFLVYISIILLICVYFVPYQSNNNYTFHSSIMAEGYGTISYFRFLIYLVIPTFLIYFIYKYLDGMNSLESSVYKKKAKNELYIFFVFVSIIIGTTIFFYVKNEYSEIRKEQLKSQISEINNSFDLLREELNKKPPFNPNLPYDVVVEKGSETQNNNFVPPSDGKVLKDKSPPLPKGFKLIGKSAGKLNLDLSGYYEKFKKEVDNVLKKTSNVRFSVNKKKQLELNIKQLIYNESSSEDLNNMIIDYVKIFSEDGINKTNLELKQKELNFYNENAIKFNVVFAFLGSFILHI